MTEVFMSEEKFNGITFGRWMLRPVGGDNWELMERNPDNKHGWSTHNRFYQYSTFANALRYAANQELKRECVDDAVALNEAIEEYERITGELMTAFKASQSAVQATK